MVVTAALTEVVAVGYNGPPAGEPNDGCRGGAGSCGCVHAEANALVKLKVGGDLLLSCSASPCEHCAGLILNSGVVRAVVFGSAYRDQAGADLLARRGVEVVEASEVMRCASY